MKNYLKINGQKIELTEEQIEQIKGSFGITAVKLSDIPVGEVAKIGKHEMIVLEHHLGTTALIRKDILKKMAFGSTNNYIGSEAQKACEAFADELAAIVGEENIVPHDVDLTADDGLDNFGKAKGCRASLITTDMYRRYVRLLDKFKPKEWWWLATAFSIPPHDGENWVKCVSPSGCILNDRYYYFGSGVRPFCILKSNIFVSK